MEHLEAYDQAFYEFGQTGDSERLEATIRLLRVLMALDRVLERLAFVARYL